MPIMLERYCLFSIRFQENRENEGHVGSYSAANHYEDEVELDKININIKL